VLPEPPRVPPLRQKRGEPVVRHPVKAADGVREVSELKSPVALPRELDQPGPPVLLPVFLQRGYVDEVAGRGPGRHRACLVAGDVVQREDRADALHPDRLGEDLEMPGLNLHHVLPVRGGDLPFGQAFARVLPDVGEPPRFVDGHHTVARGCESGLDRRRGVGQVGGLPEKYVDILRGTVGYLMGQ
jgi:hypothetical protein